MFSLLRPRSTLTETEVNRSLRLMVWDGIAGTAMFSLASGGFMAAFALALGANNLQIGVIAALPYIAQVVQLPAILAVEKIRMRKAIGAPAWWLSNLMWIPVGAVPFFMDTPGSGAVLAVMTLVGIRGVFSAIWGTCWASWMRDLVPQQVIGTYYSRRLAASLGVVAVISLAASFFVRWWTDSAAPENAVYAYSFIIIGGALTLGIASPSFVMGAREPLMPPAPDSGRPLLSILMDPLRDRNYSQLLRFLFFWSFSSNLAIPFFAVYMLTILGLALPVVIGFTVLGQLSNILFLRVWGPLADRVGSKAVLSLSASLYLLVIIGWTFTTFPGPHALTLPLLAVLHVFAGVAAAGATLTVGTLAFKVAPDDQATPFLGVAGIATNVGIGAGPIVGGVLADYFAVSSFNIDMSLSTSGRIIEIPAFSLTGFDFLFAIAFVLGLLSLNLLVALREEGEVPADAALEQLSAGPLPMMRVVSSVPGLSAVSGFSQGHLRRVPGASVALGVTAYQLAASTKAATSTANLGRSLANDVSWRVSRALRERIGGLEGVSGHGLELARHASRGAVEAVETLSGRVGELAMGAVRGSVLGLRDHSADALTTLRGAGYGVIQGASQSGENLAEAARSAIAAAREVSREIGVSEEEAASALAAGVLDAAMAEGGEAYTEIRDAIPDELAEVDDIASVGDAS